MVSVSSVRNAVFFCVHLVPPVVMTSSDQGDEIKINTDSFEDFVYLSIIYHPAVWKPGSLGYFWLVPPYPPQILATKLSASKSPPEVV